jgi:segregation and condensation protein A
MSDQIMMTDRAAEASPQHNQVVGRAGPELPFAAAPALPQQGVSFQLHDFEGPLDLLLHLIQRAEVNIYDIPIAAITHQYLHYLAAAKQDAGSAPQDGAQQVQRRLEDLTRFQVMAATLLHIKSRMLLPLPYTSEEPYEDPRQELVERLLEYQRFKRLSEVLAEQQQQAHWIITRSEPRVLPDSVVSRELADTRLSPDELLAAFKEIVAAIGGEQLTSLYEEFTVKEKIALVHERLALTAAFSFLELVRGGSAIEIICAFWAVLELAKTQAIVVIQRHQFEAITVERGHRAVAPDRAG